MIEGKKLVEGEQSEAIVSQDITMTKRNTCFAYSEDLFALYHQMLQA